MNVKILIKCLSLQFDPKKYEMFVKKLDYKKLLGEEPVEISDKCYLDNGALAETALEHTCKYFELHRKLNERYMLSAVAGDDGDFKKAVRLLNWLTENTFYNGAMLRYITDNTIEILDYAFGKTFRNAINCRLKAISFADCLVAAGIKAYPVCMQSTGFKNCHFTCRVYISELDKWCIFDPSFGCWFADKSGNPLDIFEMREMFLQDEEPAVIGYSFNGTEECLDEYMNGFLKLCISNLSTWCDNSMDRRNTKKLPEKKRFNAKLPNR